MKSGKKSRKNSDYNGFEELNPINEIQSKFLAALKSNSIIFGIGSAGTGKTFVSVGYAAQQLYYRNINKIIITRPNIEVGRGLGFLPGELEEKYSPYLEPFEDKFQVFLGTGLYQYSVKNNVIEPKPLGFMRGLSFDNCIVIADEMQNATISETKMLLSRIGENCKMIINGDINQTDIKNSGLQDATNRLKDINSVQVVTFNDSDIVRSDLCKEVIKAYNK